MKSVLTVAVLALVANIAQAQSIQERRAKAAEELKARREAAAADLMRLREGTVGRLAPITSPIPFSPAHLNCSEPDEKGRVVCHLSAQHEDMHGSYQCFVDVETCHGGYMRYLGQGEACLGAIVCYPRSAVSPAPAPASK